MTYTLTITLTGPGGRTATRTLKTTIRSALLTELNPTPPQPTPPPPQ